MIKPVISYPGAKWRFYEYIKPYIPRDIRDWREPFLGGGSMTLSILDDPDFNIEQAIVGDLAPEIFNFWLGVKNNPSAVEEIATVLFTSKCPSQRDICSVGVNGTLVKAYNTAVETGKLDEFSDRALVEENLELYDRAIKEGLDFWNWAETVDTKNMTVEERAARLLLVNKISFSGMGDSGSMSKDQYVAFSLDKLKPIYRASELLKRVEIKNVSFEETMKNVDKDKTFIFLDPPYYKQMGSGLYGRNGDTHLGFPHDTFADVTLNTDCKWFITYDDSIKVRQMFSKVAKYSGEFCNIIPFVIPGGYTLAGKTSEDALAGEELFITNYTEDDDDI